MSYWSRFKEWWRDNMVPWHMRPEWIEEETAIIHEIEEDYGESCKVAFYRGHIHRHRGTGEERRRVGKKVASTTTFADKKYLEGSSTWGGARTKEFTSTKKDEWLEQRKYQIDVELEI